MYFLTSHQDIGYELGNEIDLKREWRQLVESIQDECEVGAKVWTDRPDMRIAVLDHLALAHGMVGDGAAEFILMADRLHIWRQIRRNEQPFGLMYKR